MEAIFQHPSLMKICYKQQKEVIVLRDDLIHPYVSGNKWRKLKYNIEELKSSGKNTVITFGGAYSNHLVATAAAGKMFGFQTIGIIRGEEVENERIVFLKESGMKLFFIDRESYRKKTDPEFLNTLTEILFENDLLQKEKSDFVFIPEGGSNALAVKGAEEIMDEIPSHITTIFCACGTGGTIAGMSRRLLSHQRIKAVPVLKGAEFLITDVEKLGGDVSKIDFLFDYHFGGYAKTTSVLNDFCKQFSDETKIPVEPVYTGKVFFTLYDQLKKGTVNYHVAIVHTGGIFPGTI